MKKLITVLLVVVGTVAVLSIGKNVIAKTAVEKVCKAITGLELKINKLSIGLMGTFIAIEDLKLYNPPSFEKGTMFDIPDIYVNYDLRSILAGKTHLQEVRLDLQEMTVVKNKAGEMNLSYLKPAEADQKGTQAKQEKSAPAPSSEKKAPAREIQIDKLVLKVGKVIYKDYSGSSPKTQEFKINLDATYENITSLEILVPLLVTRALMSTTLATLTDFDMSGMMSNFKLEGMDLDQFGAGELKEMAGKLSTKATDALASVQDKINTEKAGQVINRLQSSLQGLVGNRQTATETRAVDSQNALDKVSEVGNALKGLFGTTEE